MREMKESGLPWANNVPSDWDVIRGKNTVKKLKRPVKETDGVITCFRDGEVTLRSKRREEGFTFSDLEVGYQGIEPGDLVIHGMDGFAGAIGISDSRGKGTPVLNVLESKNDKRFLMYYFRAIAKCGYFESVATGIRVRTCDTNWNKIAVTPCLVPPLVEQSSIATFLDERCGKIDEAIAKHKALIEKLDEYRKAVITAIMKSCNSDTRKLKFCVKLCTEKANDKDNYIALENIESQTGRYIGNKILPDGEAVVTKSGYVLFGKLRPYLAKCYVTEQDGCCSGEFLVMDCHKISARFLQYVLLEQTLVDKINMSTYGTKMPRANWSFVSNQLIPVPSPNEQSEIVTYLDEKCAAIDSAKERHTQLIAKLEEYKKSLIYNAVTGKIEC